MSRSDYEAWNGGDAAEIWAMICQAGALKKAVNGARGQAFLGEMLAALDAMPDKRLTSHVLQAPRFIPPEYAEGQHCAIGAVGERRGVDMSRIDPDRYDLVAKVFGVSETLTREILYWNDEGGPYPESASQRWHRMRAWVASRIKDGSLPSAVAKPL